MIFYFSGTGNSRKAAKLISEITLERLISIDHHTDLSKISYSGKILGFVCPVYGWGLPLYVEKFIRELPDKVLTNYEYSFFILTCGDDIGRTDKIIRKTWKQKNAPSPEIFSVRMRNTYVCLPGFDIDSKEIEILKETKALAKITEIAHRIKNQERATNADIIPGSYPWLKSYVLRPLFNKFLIKDRYFHVDSTKCIHCGKCIEICPLGNIQFDALQNPEWQGNCTQCLACFHRCPRHAINFGKYTKSKGQVKINF